MAVGQQATSQSVNAVLTSLALRLRDVCDDIRNYQSYVTSLGSAGLVALGLSAADATAILAQANYLANVSGCYFGTVQQGGTGGTGAILFNFDNELSQLWAGQ